MQTAYGAGLSYFPDDTTDCCGGRTGLGFVDPATVYAAAKGIQSLVGMIGGGGAQDQQRQTRAAWFLAAAQQGNIAAAQNLLGGVQSTASHEQPYYTAAIQSLQSSPGGADTLRQAEALGPYWSTSDTAANYPAARSFVGNWDMQNAPVATVARRAGSAIAGAVTTAGGGLSPAVLAVAAIAAVVLLGGRRRSA